MQQPTSITRNLNSVNAEAIIREYGIPGEKTAYLLSYLMYQSYNNDLITCATFSILDSFMRKTNV